MNVLYIDIDSLRPDHPGCYGYHRDTTPHLDHTAAFSPFAQRHGAWHWYAGFVEMHSTGGGGSETAEMISPKVTEWIQRRAHDNEKNGEQPFFLWINLWDPHTPYRTPLTEGEPFAGEPLPTWFTEEVRQAHWERCGPHSPQEVSGFEPEPEWMFRPGGMFSRYPDGKQRQPMQIDSMAAMRRMFDGYDTGVRSADFHVGWVVSALTEAGLYATTAIMISADHGENLGELWVCGEHQTADQITCRVPMVLRFTGKTDQLAGKEDDRLIYSIDAAAQVLEWCGLPVPEAWDGRVPSVAGRFFLTPSQAARRLARKHNLPLPGGK